MSDLVLGPVIGRIGGGANVETMPVSRSDMVGNGVNHEIFTIDVPAGVEYIVLVAGTMTYRGLKPSSTPILRIGGMSDRMSSTDPEVLSVWHLASPGTVTVSVETRADSTYSHFSGDVYWVALPAR